MKKTCYLCKHEFPAEDIRPYGVDGQDICYDCMMADPEREAEARRQLNKVFDRYEAESEVGIAVIGGATGPRPATVEDVKRVGNTDN